MSGLGIDFAHESEAYSTDTGSRTSATSTSTSGFHSRTRAHMIPKKSSMNKMRGLRPKTAEEDSRRVRIVSGEPSVLGHGAYTDEDFKSPSSAGDEIIVQPHQLHSLSAAVAAMGGYSTDTATSSAETDSDQSPTLTDSSASTASSGVSSVQRLKKHTSQPQLHAAELNARASGTRPALEHGRPVSEQPHPAGNRTVRESKSNTSLASGYRSDGGSSLGRSAEIPRGAGRHRVSIKGAASRQGSLQARLGPKLGAKRSQNTFSSTDAPQEAISDDETEVMVPDGFGGHTRTKQPRSRPATAGPDARPDVPALLHRIDMADESESAGRPVQWRVGSFYGPDGSETARIDHETGAISERGSQIAISDIGPAANQSHTGTVPSTVSLSRSQTSSNAPKASLMQSPSNQTGPQGLQNHDDEPAQGSTKAAALEQNRRSRTSLASVSMRSKRGLKGLEGAEGGGALVSLDNFRMTYDTGLLVLPHEITALDQDSIMGSVRLGAGQTMKTSLSQGGMAPSSSVQSHISSSPDKASEIGAGGTEASRKNRNRPRRSLSETNVNVALLERHGTLLSTTANPLRRSKELNRLLGNSDRKLPASAAKSVEIQSKNGLKRSNAVAAAVAPPPAALEQGKASKARVEVDLVLESDLVVEGGTLQGRMQICVRKGSDKEGGVFLAQPKLRVVGFEELLADDTRYIFYHHASVIDGDRSNHGPSEPYYLDGSPMLSSPETAPFSALACFSGGPDAEGYAEGKVGSHSIPFSLELPVSKGAKGSYRGKNAVVRYIVIGSVKLKSASGANRSIAHFYRHVDLFPYLNPAVVLSGAVKPIQATSSKGLFLGGSGKVHLMASLHRNTWVAGQRVYINVGIQNDTSKKINGMTLSLIRTVTLYKPRPELELDSQTARRDVDPDACQTSTTRKKIAEEELEMGQKGSRGVVTARGWWTGVESGQRVESSHYMQIPAHALSISRGRHVEVVYSIKVSIGSSLSSDVSVELPIRVINFVSIDPPPLRKSRGGKLVSEATRSWATPGSVFSDIKPPASASGATGGDGMVARLKSVDAMRSPGKTEISLQNFDQHKQAARLLSPGEVATEQTRRLQHQKSLDFINHAIRSAAARRGVDITPTTDSSTRTPSPAGLGIGVLESDSHSEGKIGHSPGENSSTDDVSGFDEDYDEDTKTPMPSTSRPAAYPPGCEPYEPHHHEAHQQEHRETYSNLPVTLHLPGGLHHMQQIQMQMCHMQSANQSFAQRSMPARTRMLPMLRINNANAVSLDDIGDDYDDVEEQEEAGDGTLALNDESMAEMNMVIGSARLDDDDEHWQFDDSVLAIDADQDGMPVLEEGRKNEAHERDGWSLRRRGLDDDEEEWIADEEADDVAEVSSIMQAVSITPIAQETSAPPPSAASAPSSIVSPAATVERQATAAGPGIPTRGDSRPSASRPEGSTPQAFVTKPLKIFKESTTTLLPQQIIRAKPSTDALPAQSATSAAIPLAKHSRADSTQHQALSTVNLKRHSDNLSCHTSQPQLQSAVQRAGHRSTYSVTGLKPLILKPRATNDGRKGSSSTAGSRTPETTSARDGAPESDTDGSEGVKTPASPYNDLPQIGQIGQRQQQQQDALLADTQVMSGARAQKALDASLSNPGAGDMPRSSTLQSIAGHTKHLRHADSTSSLISVSGTETPGALSRSHSQHNLRGASIIVPSVRNKIAMLESRASALREFTSGVTVGSGSSSPASGSPIKTSASMGKVAQLAANAEKVGGGLMTSSTSGRLGRKGSWMSTADSEDGSSSVVSSVVGVPEYMKNVGNGTGSGFNAPMLRGLR
ncbi:uncharacterized protein MEPE_04281 [Melanopsichium pennsylvanicum]|uniref:Arrestin C-terminal-like domain-containing protein n=2 Tax=Melanopsichium pennsylvanicum TaxID=63383 RepID=A0AAJ4XPL6_9BASI|nr:putative protein [Melanopsichium pennsylvanicum 4]SNX85572.1 uncharacterized protein MEPE_04281 [Melanopsichium pennsylvanicum]